MRSSSHPIVANVGQGPKAGKGSASPAVLLVRDFFHPIDGLAVERFLNGNVRHRRGWRRAVPVLLARRKPNDIARTDFLNAAALALHPAAARRDDQSLAQGVRMPGRTRARLECDARSGDTCGIGRLKQRVDTDCAGEPVRRTFGGWLRTAAFDLHCFLSGLRRSLKTHEMRSGAKPTAVPPLVNIRVASIANFTGKPFVPVTGMNDREVTQDAHHYVHSLRIRPWIWICDALEKRFAIQKGAIRGGDIKVLGKILRIPA